MVRVLTTLLVAAALLVGSDAYDSGAGGRSTSQRAGGGSVRQRNRVNVIVTMKERTSPVLDSINSQKFATRGQRISALRQGLESHARASQARVTEVLESSGSSFSHSESYWVTNQMYIAGASPDLIDKLSRLPNVASVSTEHIFPLDTPVSETPAFGTSAVTVQSGVASINAPQVWSMGKTGTGIVVGIIDTGARATHQAISGNFRSSYGWYDPEQKILTPYDATGHGTHVTGIIAGNNGYGVAPGAQWIMCKGCRSTGCYTSDLLACFQFMLCPTTPDGLTKDCTKAPHVVNNSWGGGSGLTTFDTVINSWRTAGIIPVVAAGNTGPSCGTTQSPGDNVNVITVGATDTSDNLASYSAKGPTKTGAPKPDLVARGSSITSSCYTGDADYCTKTGTSMSTPIVTGAIALYLSASGGTTYTNVKTAFQQTAKAMTTATGYTCGNTPDSMIPNNQFGYGRIDVSKAIATIPPTQAPTLAPIV